MARTRDDAARRVVAPVAGLLAAVAVEAWLVHRTAAVGGILARRTTLFAEVCGAFAAWAAALACLRLVPWTARTRRALLLLLVALAVVLRLAAVSAKAPLSDDLYRYAWDGVVQSSGTDPYRYPPNAPQLQHLRDPWLWPPALADQPRRTLLNRAGVRTIYPPVAEAWFWLEHRLVPLSARDQGYERAGLGLDLAVLAALLALLRRTGRDERAAAVWALSPLPVLEAVQNAHVDVLAVLFVLAAVAASGGQRLSRLRRPVLVSAALAGAALVKVYPGLLLPLLLRRRGARASVVAVAAGLAVLAYLPHVLAVGPEVVGYLPGYLREEQYGSGSRYLLLGLVGLSGTPATVVVALAVVVLVVLVVRADLPLAPSGVRLLAGVFLLVTPVQPWYALVLLALVVVAGDWWALPLTAAAYPLYFATILDGPAVAAGRLAYGAAGLVVAAAAWRGRRVSPVSRPRSA